MDLNTPKTKVELIVTIVERGASGDVIDAAKEAGAGGATVVCGRGSADPKKANFFGITIEPEKELVLILVEHDIRRKVQKAIASALDIDKPGNGVLFVVDVTSVIGISHFGIIDEDE